MFDRSMSSQTSSDRAISATNLTVRYRVLAEPHTGFKDYVIRRLQGQARTRDILALRNVSFNVDRGEVVGIVGRNGAGKSTLLKAIARVLPPTSGRIQVEGTVAPLLQLGGGFHPELTGRENIFLYSALLGRSRSETSAALEAIVDFSGLGGFLDVPLRNFSSGMAARLGFAVATCRPADLYLIDEVLAVGDWEFQQRCLDHIREVKARRASVALVSHSLDVVAATCDRVLWISEGVLRADGEPDQVIESMKASGAAREGNVVDHSRQLPWWSNSGAEAA